MKVTIWGSRGSCAAPGPDTARYGGNTSCVEVRLDGDARTLLVFDAGTGIRALGERLMVTSVPVVHIFLSHLHLDHLQGLAFFAPLYRAATEVHVWGPPSASMSLRERIGAYMSEPLFPVHVSEIPSDIQFHDAPDMHGVRVGSATVKAAPVTHRGPTVGYRIEEDGATLAYVPDHEPALGSRHLDDVDPAWISGFGLIAGADVLVHDAQYSELEYPAKVGWGHSSVEHVVTLATMAEVGRLVMFHHDPSHDDASLDALGRRAVELWKQAGAEGPAPVLAADGMTFSVRHADVLA